MNSPRPSQHNWKPGARPSINHRPITVPARRVRTLDGVSGEVFTVQPAQQKKTAIPSQVKTVIRHRPYRAAMSHTTPKPAQTSHRRTHKKLASTAAKALLLDKKIAETASPHKEKRDFHHRVRQKIFSKQSFAFSIAALVLIATGYVTVDTWLTNRRVSAVESPAPTVQKNDREVHTSGRPDQTPLPKNALKDYKTAADTPRAVYIDKIKVAARALPMKVDKKGALEAPKSIFDAGWYTDSGKPGVTGAMLFDGHSSGSTELGAFGKIGTLVAGDIITIETGDGTKYQYKVVAKETVAKDKVDMQKALLPYGNSLQGANFITCAGKWTADNTTMTDRTIVYTVRV